MHQRTGDEKKKISVCSFSCAPTARSPASNNGWIFDPEREREKCKKKNQTAAVLPLSESVYHGRNSMCLFPPPRISTGENIRKG
jgi:hypothetical protein